MGIWPLTHSNTGSKTPCYNQETYFIKGGKKSANEEELDSAIAEISAFIASDSVDPIDSHDQHTLIKRQF